MGFIKLVCAPGCAVRKYRLVFGFHPLRRGSGPLIDVHKVGVAAGVQSPEHVQKRKAAIRLVYHVCHRRPVTSVVSLGTLDRISCEGLPAYFSE
jgi:hypothetical protein